MKTSIKFSFLFLFTVIACRPSFKNKLNEALYIAGKNKPELEKVIIHYSRNPDDSLKLKAAYFLIENMGNKFGLYPDIKAANKYNVVFERLRALYKNRANTMENRMVINPIIKALWDSIEQKVGDIGIDKKLDCQVIKADYLIENIDYSFKVWYEKPWCRHLSFEQFCESILPYRFKDEPLQYYKKRFYQEFSWIDDSVKDKTDPKEACLIMNRHIAQNFNFSDKLDKYSLRGINDMYNLNGSLYT